MVKKDRAPNDPDRSVPERDPRALAARVRARALALGFTRVGVAAARRLDEDFSRYERYLEEGLHGTMAYLAEHREARARVDGPEILEGARSVIVCAMDYRHAPDEAAIAGGSRAPGLRDGGVIARYARGADYHNFLRKRLRKLADFVRRACGAEARPMVDTAPVLERAWARLAGVGFVGKNGCLIAPGVGSFVLLGEVVTTAELAPDEPMESRCGSCELCLRACPTEAFVRPFVLDAGRCVSFLTIEHRGAIPEPLRAGVGDRLFGCDVCQDVCPYNKTSPGPAEPSAPFALGARWSERDLRALLALDEGSFAALTEGSALARPGREGLLRNALTVLGNVGTIEHLPALRATAEGERSPVLGEAARWAIARIEAREADGVLSRRETTTR
jgi:epoxyqueuosine reductase